MNGRSRKAERAAREKKRQKARAFRDDTGRVHLALQRDPESGHEKVTLKAPLYAEAWQNEAVTGTANTVLGILEHTPTLERVVDLARRVMASTSRLVTALLSRAPEGSVACKAGCEHCCYQLVAVTAPEALAIFDHLQRSREAPALEALKARVHELHQRSRGLSSAERFSPEHPCVFLEAGSCSIYEVRPLACRGVNSLDAGECQSRLHDPAARAEFLARGHAGRCFVEPLQAFRAIGAGLSLALSELYRLDSRALDLTAAMQVLFDGAASVPSAWIAGDQPFRSALREGAPLGVTPR